MTAPQLSVDTVNESASDCIVTNDNSIVKSDNYDILYATKKRA